MKENIFSMQTTTKITTNYWGGPLKKKKKTNKKINLLIQRAGNTAAIKSALIKQ